jgi:hypothetical protein
MYQTCRIVFSDRKFGRSGEVRAGLSERRGGQQIFCTAQLPYRLWGPPSFLSNGHVIASCRCDPGSIPDHFYLGFVVEKVELGQVISCYSVYPANYHSSRILYLIVCHLLLVQWAIQRRKNIRKTQFGC